MPEKPTRGRPPEAEPANAIIKLRVKARRKSAYVRTASKAGMTLAKWMQEQCDAGSGFAD